MGKSRMRTTPALALGEFPKPYLTAREDLAKIIAQETSGVKGAIPESDDYKMAERFINIINGKASWTYYNPGDD